MAKSHQLINDGRPQLSPYNMFRFLSPESITLPSPPDEDDGLVFETAREIQLARLAKREALEAEND